MLNITISRIRTDLFNLRNYNILTNLSITYGNIGTVNEHYTLLLR